MAYKETDFKQPVRHNPYLHQIVIENMKSLPKGRVLDLPSGAGYLIRDLQAIGFEGIAAEIDHELHVFPDVKYQPVDMTKTFPFPDASFDYVISIEGIEHIENHLSFIREVKRVLKPGGRFIVTTPNIHSLESRWNYFVSGFHLMAPKPIPLNTENIYFEHINPITLNQLYFYLVRTKFQVEKLLTHRFKKGSLLLYFLFYPFVRWGVYRACRLAEKDASRRAMNDEIYKLLSSKANQLGSHTIVMAKN